MANKLEKINVAGLQREAKRVDAILREAGSVFLKTCLGFDGVVTLKPKSLDNAYFAVLRNDSFVPEIVELSPKEVKRLSGQVHMHFIIGNANLGKYGFQSDLIPLDTIKRG